MLQCLMLAALLLLGTISPACAWEPDAEYEAQWGLEMIHADEAYRLNLTGAEITIGILDSGINPDHSEFINRPISGYDFLANTTSLTDPMGHGSHVSGIIGAARDGVGMHGIAFDSSLVAVRFIAEDNPNEPIAESVDYFINQTSASIINNSWEAGTSITETTKEQFLADEKSKLWLEAFQRATANNKLIVFAAGNQSKSSVDLVAGIPQFFPELQPNWLAVVALDTEGKRAAYSNRAGIAKEWTISAPGGGLDDHAYVNGIYSVATGMVDEFLGDGKGYAAVSGTSMAAPHVSGAAALVWQAFPYFTAAQISQTLLLTATDIGEIGIDDIYGWGLLNVGKAVSGVQADDLPNYLPNHYSLLVPLSGNGGLTVTGGRFLTLTGNNTYTGSTSVQDSSTLIINGRLTSQIEVDSSSTLGGSGLINNSVTLSGILSPGNSPGTLTVTGDFNQANGSAYLAELGGTSLNQYDQIKVGGQYLCGLNVTLIPQLYGGYQPRIGDAYIIVDATGGRTGNYSTIDQSASLAGMQFDVLYSQDKINLYSTPDDYTQTSLLGWKWNNNQAAVAKVWEKGRPAPGKDLNNNQQELYTTLFPLNAAGLQQAASQMSGQLIADSQGGALDQLRNLNHTIGKMVVEGETVKLFSNSMDVDSNNVSGRSLRSSGAVVNYQLGQKNNQRWGLGIDYSKGKVKSDSGPGSAAIDSYGLHYYNYQQPKDWYIQTQIGFGQTQQRHEREIGQANVSGKTNGEHFFGRLAIGKKESQEEAKYGLEAALLWESVQRKSMTETGDQTYTVSSSSVRHQRLASQVSLTSKHILQRKNGLTTTLDTKLGWVHDFTGLDNQVDLKWRGENMNIRSEKLGADALQYGLGLNWRWGKDYQFQLSALGEHRSNSRSFNMEASMSHKW